MIFVTHALPEVLSWQEWLEEFSENNGLVEVYLPSKQNVDRKNIYLDNVRFIREHNARHDKGLETFRLGVNQFSAMSSKEWSSTMTGGSIPRTRDAIPSPEVVQREISRRRINTNVTSIDWRKKNVVTPIKNQGACGSCWSFSATGAIEVAVAIETGNLISLSEQQLMDCGSAEGEQSCEGGLIDGAFEYVLENHGLDSEADYPYKMMDEACKRNKENRHVSTITSFHDVGPN